MSDTSPDKPDCPGCRSRDEIIARQQEQIRALEKRVGKLEARQAANSTNSSRPPSSDGPADRSERESSGESDNSQGAQPGHEGRTREEFDADQVDEFVDIKPDACRGCGCELQGHDTDPSTHQVTDVEIRKVVVEYRRHTLACGECGRWTHADLPDDVPTGKFGPTISALVTYLSSVSHLSKRATQEAADQLFGVQMSVGTVSNMEARLSGGLAGPYWRARGWVSESGRVHLDETGWWQEHARHWLWTIGDGDVVAYRIDESRSGDVARQLLGGQPTGEVVTDRYTGYNWIELDSRFLCWPHLYRNFKGWALEDGLVGHIGGVLVGYTRELFVWLGRIRDGTADMEAFGEFIDRMQDNVSDVLKLGAKACDPPDRFEELLDLEDAMWAFVDADGWPTNNNEAERSLRDAVLWRKQSFGTQSDRGSRFVERILTITETLKRQKRRVFDFLEDVWSHISHGDSMPNLLPT